MISVHIRRGLTSGIFVSTCSWIDKKTPESVKKVGKTIGTQVCCDSLLDFAEGGFKVLKAQVTLKRYVTKTQFVLSCTSTVDFGIRTGIVIIPEVCRVAGTITPFKFLTVGGSLMDAYIVPEMSSHILLESARVIRFTEFADKVPGFIQDHGGGKISSAVRKFLDLKGGNQLNPIRVTYEISENTPPFMNPKSVFYKPIFKLRDRYDNYHRLKQIFHYDN